MTITENDLRIEHSSLRKQRQKDTRCSLCGSDIGQVKEWEMVVRRTVGATTTSAGVDAAHGPVCSTCGKAESITLSKLLDRLNEAGGEVGAEERFLAITRWNDKTAYDLYARVIYTPRRYEICHAGNEHLWLPVRLSDDQAPNLSRALHEHFGTKPEPKPHPRGPLPETEAERQARMKREQVLQFFKGALDGRQANVDQRAEWLLEGLLTLARKSG